jgi:hypothetical protein
MLDNLGNSISLEAKSIDKPAMLEWMTLEINKIPQEYWPYLLQMIQLFGKTTNVKEVPRSNSWEPEMTDIKNLDSVQAIKNQDLRELLRSWREEGDEQEQKETWEILSKALNENHISI